MSSYTLVVDFQLASLGDEIVEPRKVQAMPRHIRLLSADQVFNALSPIYCARSLRSFVLNAKVSSLKDTQDRERNLSVQAVLVVVTLFALSSISILLKRTRK